MPQERRERENRNQRLPENFLPRGNAVAILADNLEPIVTETHGGQSRVNKECDDDPDIRSGPQERTEKYRGKYKQTTHCGRVLFVETRGEVPRPIIIIMLSKFQFPQFRDQPRPNEKSDQRCRHGRAHRAKSLRAKHAQRAEKILVVCEIA